MIEVELKKVHILQILESYYRIFRLVYVGFDSDGITLQGSCDERRILTATTINRDSLESYVCDGRSMVVEIRKCMMLGGRL